MVIEETGKGTLGGRQPVAFVRIAHLQELRIGQCLSNSYVVPSSRHETNGSMVVAQIPHCNK